MTQTFIIPKENRDRMIDRLSGFLRDMTPGKPIKVEVGPYRKTRSSQQNNALWGVAYPAIREATGIDVNDLHEYLLGEWSGWSETEVFGRKKLKPHKRSSKLSTVEFSDYYAFIQQRMAEEGIYVPDPDPFREDA